MKSRLILLLAVLTCLPGCASLGAAIIVADKEGVNATDSADVPTRTGKACAMNILGIVQVGDGSVAAAKMAGGITKVSTIDVENLSVLGIYGQKCIVLTGN